MCKMLVPQRVSARIGHEVRHGGRRIGGSCRWDTQLFDLRIEHRGEHVVLRRVVAIQRAQRDRGYNDIVSVEVLSAALRELAVDALVERLHDATAPYWLS